MGECTCILCSGKWESDEFTPEQKLRFLLAISAESRDPKFRAAFEASLCDGRLDQTEELSSTIPSLRDRAL